MRITKALTVAGLLVTTAVASTIPASVRSQSEESIEYLERGRSEDLITDASGPTAYLAPVLNDRKEDDFDTATNDRAVGAAEYDEAFNEMSKRNIEIPDLPDIYVNFDSPNQTTVHGIVIRGKEKLWGQCYRLFFPALGLLIRPEPGMRCAVYVLDDCTGGKQALFGMDMSPELQFYRSYAVYGDPTTPTPASIRCRRNTMNGSWGD